MNRAAHRSGVAGRNDALPASVAPVWRNLQPGATVFDTTLATLSQARRAHGGIGNMWNRAGGASGPNMPTGPDRATGPALDDITLGAKAERFALAIIEHCGSATALLSPPVPG